MFFGLVIMLNPSKNHNMHVEVFATCHWLGTNDAGSAWFGISGMSSVWSITTILYRHAVKYLKQLCCCAADFALDSRQSVASSDEK